MIAVAAFHSSTRAFSLVACFALAVSFACAATEFPGAAQPQLAVAADGRLWLAFGQGKEVCVTRSDDGGQTFAPTVKVTTRPELMLGMRRGPRIAAVGDRVTVTMNAKDLIAFHSSDGGRTWSGPVAINDVPTSAREGLHDLASAPDGHLFATWLDLRNSRTELYGAESRDGGRTWGPNELVYRSPEKSICECCHPSALFDAAGNLAVMWRNSIGGARDLWLAKRTAGAKQFSAAVKLGAGTWDLKACPMDGGDIIARGGGKFDSVWQRAGEVFFNAGEIGARELDLGPGKQPVAATVGAKTLVVWQQGADLWSVEPGGSAPPAKRAANARFPVLAALPGGSGAVLAYERSTSVVIERW